MYTCSTIETIECILGKVIILNKVSHFGKRITLNGKIPTHPPTNYVIIFLSLPQNNLIKLLPSIFISITFLDAFYTIMI